MKEEVSQCICSVGNFKRGCPYTTTREKLEDYNRRHVESLLAV